MGGDLSIRTLAALEDVRRLQAGLPFRVQGVRGVRLHPPGKALVEPEVVPPRHRDKVAEPLMCHFVADDDEDELPLALYGCCRIEQKMILRKENGAPILHRTAAYLSGCGDQIELRQRKAHAKVIVVVVQQGHSLIKRVGCLDRVAALDHYTDVDAVYLTVDALEIADAQEQKIGRHSWCLGEAHPLQAIPQRCNGCNRRVRERHPVGGHIHRNRESSLQSRLVPTGQQAPRICRFKVGGQCASLAGRSVVVHRKEANGPRRDRPVIGDRQGVAAGRECRRKGDCRPPQLLVQCDRATQSTVQTNLVES